MGYCVYLLECSDKSYYCGMSTDIIRRVLEHNKGTGAKYTKARRPVHLIACTNHNFTRKDAAKLELRIKSLPRKEKLSYLENLIEIGNKRVTGE